ncbi:MAG TPA: DUF6786 family protein [Polyangiaceae bacterium]
MSLGAFNPCWIDTLGCALAASVALSCTPVAPEAPQSACPPMKIAAPSPSTASPAFTSFDDDLAFLTRHGTLKVLTTPSGARVAISPQYQARVMTSAVEPGGRSLGFINRKFIEEGKTGTQFDNYGGEDRFWLGPEGGQFGLYFPPQKPFVFDNWQTPHALQEGSWDVVRESASSVTFSHVMTLSNYAGREFKIEITREIALLTPERAAEQLGVAVPAGVQWVGISSSNTLKNVGSAPWLDSGGLLSVWILGMFAPVAGTRVIVPFDKNGAGEIVNDRYFGKVPADRLAVQADQGYLLFRADGQYRSKIGLGPTRAKSALGSYSDDAKLLTLVLYSKPTGATRYVNSMWELQKEPYGGDVINSYNDGPPAPGKPSLGGFYEIESSSPATALAPGESLTHVHTTYHFSGPREALDILAQRVLGVSLASLPAG